MSSTLKVLIGPLTTPAFLGKYAQGYPNIKTFSSLHASPMIGGESPSPPSAFDYTYDSQADFAQFLARLGDFQPEIICWLSVGYPAIPKGIADSPVPTALLVHDWYGVHVFSLLDFLGAFDGIFCDGHLAEILQAQGHQQVYTWPSYGLDPNQFFLMSGLERIYDICFAGNLAPNYYARRNADLRCLLDLSETYRVCISQGQHKGMAYTKLLNQSKIVLNPTMHGEMNLRAYEAPACGALLFIEAENKEIQNYLPPGQACITYTPETLLPLLHHYLQHEAERQTIASAGYQAIQAFSYEKQFESLLTILPQVISQQKTPIRPALKISDPRQTLIQIRQHHFSRSPKANEDSLEQLQRLLPQAPFEDQALMSNAAGALFINQALDYYRLGQAAEKNQSLLNSLGPQAQAQFHTGLSYLKNLSRSSHPLHHYNLGWAYAFLLDYPQALACFQKSLDLLKTWPFDPSDLNYHFVLPMGHHQRHLTQFYTVWQLAFLLPKEHPSPYALLQSQMLMILGYHQELQGQFAQAEISYTEALNCFPNCLELQATLAQNLKLQGKTQAALAQYLDLTERFPFIYPYHYQSIFLAWNCQALPHIQTTLKRLKQLLKTQETAENSQAPERLRLVEFIAEVQKKLETLQI